MLGRIFSRNTLAAVVAMATLGVPSAATATVTAGFTDSLVASVAAPTALAFTPDGRLLVASQSGALRVVQGGTLVGTPALDFGPDVPNTCDTPLFVNPLPLNPLITGQILVNG